ncbi:MAG: dipeptidase [Bacteroidales bacterium]|nr:dipeptidase [Bacteroidales bacterium]
MDIVKTYIEKNKNRFIGELFEMLRVPSVSALKESEPKMEQMARLVCQHLLKAGADMAEVMTTSGWPVVFGEKIINRNLPTIMVYGHYDVQPPDPLDLWKTPPFEPEIKDDKIYARGADDDKGQLFMQIKAFEYMVAENKLPCNVKFLIEGEEEIGSPALKEFCKENKSILSTDVILVSDTNIHSLKKPVITTGLRGIAYFEISVTGPDRDLHSGLYGGAVANPVNVLSGVIAGMKDPEGKIKIPGFYDDVLEVDLNERKLLNEINLNEKEFAASINVEELSGEKGYTTVERIGIRPTLDINGIWGGYTGEGAKTILPSIASVKVSTRLVPNQRPEKVKEQLIRYLKEATPKSVRIELKTIQDGNAYVCPWDSKEVQSAAKALEKTLGVKPIPNRGGGSIPVITVLEEVLSAKSVLLGFGLESDAIHSPNENYPLKNLYKGIETLPWFYHFYCK